MRSSSLLSSFLLLRKATAKNKAKMSKVMSWAFLSSERVAYFRATCAQAGVALKYVQKLAIPMATARHLRARPERNDSSTGIALLATRPPFRAPNRCRYHVPVKGIAWSPPTPGTKGSGHATYQARNGTMRYHHLPCRRRPLDGVLRPRAARKLDCATPSLRMAIW